MVLLTCGAGYICKSYHSLMSQKYSSYDLHTVFVDGMVLGTPGVF